MGPANMHRALREQSGNYDETTSFVFITPDGQRWVWDDVDVLIDWDGDDMVLYIAPEHHDDDK